MNFMKIASIFVVVILFPCLVLSVSAQSAPIPLDCGQIVEGEFLQRQAEGNQEYSINLAPGDTLTVSGDTVGDYLKFGIRVIAPTTGDVGYTYNAPWGDTQDAPSMETEILSERGRYTIRLNPNGPGLYTLYIGCTLRDGTVIAPGDAIPETQPSTPTTVTSELPSGFVGFRGLAPVDFSSVNPFSIPPNVPMTGGVTPTGGEILGYLINGNEGDVLEIQFTRLSGNLNLGLVVLSQNNELAFQASLITTNSLTTQLTLPSTGDFTVGIFRVDLLPPDDPESTTFQIQTVINP